MVAGTVLAWAGCDGGDDPAATGGGGPSTGGGGSAATGGGGGSTSTGTGMPLFETDIVPIFDASCGSADAACHSEVAYAATASAECRGWLALKNEALGSQIYGGVNDGQPTGCPDMPLYDRLLQLDAWQVCGGQLKRYIVPCNVEASYLFDKIDDGPYCGETPDAPSEPMPKGVAMDPNEREIIRAWILAGAPRVDGTKTDCNGMIGQAPQPVIFHPGDMETRPAGMAIPFIGSATDAEDGDIPGDVLVWTSDLDGEIGVGAQFDAPLSVGTHVVTLTARDSDANEASTSITLYIQ